MNCLTLTESLKPALRQLTGFDPSLKTVSSARSDALSVGENFCVATDVSPEVAADSSPLPVSPHADNTPADINPQSAIKQYVYIRLCITVIFKQFYRNIKP